MKRTCVWRRFESLEVGKGLIAINESLAFIRKTQNDDPFVMTTDASLLRIANWNRYCMYVWDEYRCGVIRIQSNEKERCSATSCPYQARLMKSRLKELRSRLERRFNPARKEAFSWFGRTVRREPLSSKKCLPSLLLLPLSNTFVTRRWNLQYGQNASVVRKRSPVANCQSSHNSLGRKTVKMRLLLQYPSYGVSYPYNTEDWSLFLPAPILFGVTFTRERRIVDSRGSRVHQLLALLTPHVHLS